MPILKSLLPYIAPFLLIAAIAVGEKVKPEETHTLITDKKVAVVWDFHGEQRVWLEVRGFNGDAWKTEGYHPSFSAIIVRDYKPLIKQLPDGRWQITFTSPIAENLP